VTPCHMREVFRANMYKSKQFTSVRFRDFVVLRVDEKSEKSPALKSKLGPFGVLSLFVSP